MFDLLWFNSANSSNLTNSIQNRKNTRVFQKLDDIGNNTNIGIRGFRGQINSERECLTWNQRLTRGLGSILTGGNIFHWMFFYFHVVMPLMQLLPMLCACEKLDWP